MISLVIISGLIFFDYGTHPTHAVGVKSTPQLGNSLRLVATPSNYQTNSEAFILPPERSSKWHRIRRREAVRTKKHEINNTIPYALKPVKVEGHADYKKNDGGRSVGDEQNLIKDNNGLEGPKRQVVYDQFNNAFSVLIKSEDSGSPRADSQLPITLLARKSSSELNEVQAPYSNLDDDTQTVEPSNEDESEHSTSPNYNPISSQRFLSHLPYRGGTSEDNLSKATSQGPEFPNKELYRVSSFLGTFGIAGNVTDRKYCVKMDDRYKGRTNTGKTNRRMQHSNSKSTSHNDKINIETREDNSSENIYEHNVGHLKQHINNNNTKKKSRVNDYHHKSEQNIENSDDEIQINAIIRSSREDVQARNVNFSDVTPWLGKSLHLPGYIKVYKTNGSHILGVRQIRPSKRARKLMFGKTKKIKPFPFSFVFPNKTISFPMKINTGENNEIKLSEFYDAENSDDVAIKLFRPDQEQSGAEQYQRIINQTNHRGSTGPEGDHRSFNDDDDSKIPTLAPPIYKPGRAEVKFAPTNEDLIRAGILMLNDDENKVHVYPDNEKKLDPNMTTHSESLPAEKYYDKFTEENTDYEREQDDMSIFIESKHKMTYIRPPKVVAETYGDRNFLAENNYPLSLGSSSLDTKTNNGLKALRKPHFTARPYWLVEQPNHGDRVRFTPSTSASRKLDHPVSIPRSWHRNPFVQTTSLPLQKWTLYHAGVPPTRRSSLVKMTNGYLDDETGIEHHTEYFAEPVLRSVAFPAAPSRDLDPAYHNWKEVANYFGDVSSSNFRHKKVLSENTLLQKPSRETQYIIQQSSNSPVYQKFRNYHKSKSTPSTLYREHTESPHAHSFNENDFEEIISELPEYYEQADHLQKSIVESSTNEPILFQHQTPLAPSLPGVETSVTAPRDLLITTNETDERDNVRAKGYPGDIKNSYDTSSRHSSPLTDSALKSATAESPLDSRNHIYSGEVSTYSGEVSTYSYHNQTYTSNGGSSFGSEETKIIPVLTKIATKTATTKKKTPYDRIFQKSGIPKSYYSDTSSDSENAEGSSSDEAENQDYPRYSEVPRTLFSCEGRYRGYYADPRAQCQVFHLCQRSGQRASFLCPNGTLFSQRLLTCDHWQAVDCERTELYYHVNKDLYREHPTTTTNDSPFLKKNKIRFQEEETKNIIWHAEESQPARTYRLPPIPSLVTLNSSMDSRSSSSLIPRYPGIKDLLRGKEITKESYRRLKIKSKVNNQRKVPEPRTVRPHVVDPEMVDPYIVV